MDTSWVSATDSPATRHSHDHCLPPPATVPVAEGQWWENAQGGKSCGRGRGGLGPESLCGRLGGVTRKAVAGQLWWAAVAGSLPEAGGPAELVAKPVGSMPH